MRSLGGRGSGRRLLPTFDKDHTFPLQYLYMSDITMNTFVWKEDGMYVSYAPQLDVSSCGKTAREAKKNIKEALGLFLEEAAAMGTLDDILTESGLKRKQKTWKAPERVALERVRFAV